MQNIYQINPSYIFATMFIVFLLSLGVIFTGKKVLTWMAAGEELYTLPVDRRRQFGYRQSWFLLTIGSIVMTGGITSIVQLNLSGYVCVICSMVIALGAGIVVAGLAKWACHEQPK